MTKELKDALDAEMEAALDSGDTDRIRDAVAHSTKALCDCQMKTAERVKVIVADHPQLVNDVKAIKALLERGKQTLWHFVKEIGKYLLFGGGAVELLRWMLDHKTIVEQIVN